MFYEGALGLEAKQDPARQPLWAWAASSAPLLLGGIGQASVLASVSQRAYLLMQRKGSHQALAAVADDGIDIGRFAVVNVARALYNTLLCFFQAAKVVLGYADASFNCEVGSAIWAFNGGHSALLGSVYYSPTKGLWSIVNC